MVVRAAFAVLLAGLGWLTACSGKTVDEGAGGASGDGPSPVEQCETYATTWCNKAFGCYVQVGRLNQASLQSNVDECIKVIENALPCSGVISTSGEYDKCISQMKAIPCSRWDVPQSEFGTVRPPTSCDNALEL